MSKTYKVREIFLTIQGEGEFAGRVAVFLRFSLCNLWSGVDVDRPKGAGACALWCDTDFTGGVRYGPKALVAEVVKVFEGAASFASPGVAPSKASTRPLSPRRTPNVQSPAGGIAESEAYGASPEISAVGVVP